MEYLDSIKDYLVAIFSNGIFLVTVVFASFEYGAEFFFPKYREFISQKISDMKRKKLKYILLITFVIASFLAFHDVKIESCKDESGNTITKEELKELRKWLEEYRAIEGAILTTG